MSENKEENCILPHHKQLELCTARLPYRQGRKLTAVKAYTINNESKHLLIFGVPSLNLRQETKHLFIKFGKLIQFRITKHTSEQFTETYHVIYENIQSARLAKKMLDTKNFYGGNLHVCYAPELETIQETREKILLRRKNVLSRLKNLDKDKNSETKSLEEKPVELKNLDTEVFISREPTKINMADFNCIEYSKSEKCDYKSVKRRKYTDISKDKTKNTSILVNTDSDNKIGKNTEYLQNVELSNSIDVIDITSTNKEIVTNVNESLNFNIGQELIKEIPLKPVNKIVFNVNKKS